MGVVRTRYVDYTADGTPVGRCIVLPGSTYTPEAPMLFFAAQVALMRGWDAHRVWWQVPQFSSDAEEVAWVGSRLDAAVDGYPGRVMVVAKSLVTLAAPVAAARCYDAAWPTPLLAKADVVEPPSSYPAAQFVAIGSSDPFFSQGRARRATRRAPRSGR